MRCLLATSLVLLACAHAGDRREPSPSAVALPRGSRGPDQSPTYEVPLAAFASERNRCIDRELARLELNEFGDPRGTSYPEGAPLAVARGADPHDYVMRHRRDVAVRCSAAPGEAPR